MNFVVFFSIGILAAVVTIAVTSYIFRNYFAAIPLHSIGNVLPLARALSGVLPDVPEGAAAANHEPELSGFLGGGELRINSKYLIAADKLNVKFNFLLSPEFFADSQSLLSAYLPVVIDGGSTQKFGLKNGDLAWVRKRAQSETFEAGDIVLIKKNDGNQQKDHALKARRLYAREQGSAGKWLTLAYDSEGGSEPGALGINHHCEEDFVGTFAYKIKTDGSAHKFQPTPYSAISSDLQRLDLEPPSILGASE